jgi:Ala-tRNA(Pro) deacylase
MSCKEKLEQYLHEHQILFQVQQHPIAFTAQDVAATEHLPGKQVAKVVIAFADGHPVMLALPAPYRVDLARVGLVLGTQAVRLADEVELAELFPDCEVGAMPPFGNLYHLPVYVDQRLAEDEDIVFPAGTHTETIRLAYADFARLVRPIVAAFAHPPQEALP